MAKRAKKNPSEQFQASNGVAATAAAHGSVKSSRKKLKQDFPDRFLNRELSWLGFNERVLAQAAQPTLPILERAKFLAITGSNLDEFMMVRVGGLKILRQRNPSKQDPAGMLASEQLQAVAERTHRFVERQYELWRQQVGPQLATSGIVEINLSESEGTELRLATERFQQDIFPVLSPQAVTADAFPMVRGLGMHLLVRLEIDAETRLGVLADSADEDGQQRFEWALLPMGRTLPRLMPSASNHRMGYVLLEQLVRHFVAEFFPGRKVLECTPFRITRNADIELREDEASDLLGGMEEVLESRRFARAVRLEYCATASEHAVEFLRQVHDLDPQDLYPIQGPLDLSFLFSLHSVDGFEKLRDEVWPATPHPKIDPDQSMFSTIEGGDLLLVHPYQQFDSVVRLIEEAAVDPDVLAIKQVLYRTSKNSPVIAALERAAERGKYVTAIVELKARFDEARNIEWAREMERSGVQVIYGIHGLKTHAKICIIVRRQSNGIRRYMHFGTGNYNEVTARIYSDVSLLTCDEVLGRDATNFFNAVTGASQPVEMEELAAAPLQLRQRVLNLIEGETQRCMQSGHGRIIAKLNALVDTEVIDALYRASQAGVKIKLNIRGQCCLRPGVKGLSESIEVVSIVDRFLEHARIFCFHQNGNEKVYISSADWMPRNLDRRVELMVPVSDPTCSSRLRDVLNAYFKDNVNAWRMQADGRYEKVPTPKDAAYRVQYELYRQEVELSSIAQSSRRQTFRPVSGSS